MLCESQSVYETDNDNGGDNNNNKLHVIMSLV